MAIRVRHSPDLRVVGQSAYDTGLMAWLEAQREQEAERDFIRERDQARFDQSLEQQERQIRASQESELLRVRANEIAQQKQIEASRLSQLTGHQANLQSQAMAHGQQRDMALFGHQAGLEQMGAQAQLQAGMQELEYTQQQRQELNKLHAARNFIAQSDDYTEAEKEIAYRQIDAKLMGIQPVIPKESPFPEGQDVGQLWTEVDPTTGQELLFTRDDKGIPRIPQGWKPSEGADDGLDTKQLLAIKDRVHDRLLEKYEGREPPAEEVMAGVQREIAFIKAMKGGDTEGGGEETAPPDPAMLAQAQMGAMAMGAARGDMAGVAGAAPGMLAAVGAMAQQPPAAPVQQATMAPGGATATPPTPVPQVQSPWDLATPELLADLEREADQMRVNAGFMAQGGRRVPVQRPLTAQEKQVWIYQQLKEMAAETTEQQLAGGTPGPAQPGTPAAPATADPMAQAVAALPPQHQQQIQEAVVTLKAALQQYQQTLSAEHYQAAQQAQQALQALLPQVDGA